MGGRRGKGEGSIHKRADGRWCAYLTLGDGKRKSFYGKTKREAQEKLLAAQRAQSAGLPVVPERQTVAQYLTDWLAYKKSRMVYAGWRMHESLTRVHIIPALGGVRLAQLNAQQVQSFYSRLGSDGHLNEATIGKVHATLRGALRRAVRLGLVARNVTDLVDAPHVAHREMRVLDVAQARTLLAAVRGHRHEALYWLALSTGMRIGELLALSWGAVDLDGGRLSVQATLTRREHGPGDPGDFTISSGAKTRHSRRTVALGAPVVEHLRAHRVRQLEERLAMGDYWHAGLDLVFANPVGVAYDPSSLRSHLRALLRRAGLPTEYWSGERPLRFHDLRHTAATLALGPGKVNPKVVSEMLGHASVAFTLDLYAHVLPDMQADAASAMATLLTDTASDRASLDDRKRRTDDG